MTDTTSTSSTADADAAYADRLTEIILRESASTDGEWFFEDSASDTAIHSDAGPDIVPYVVIDPRAEMSDEPDDAIISAADEAFITHAKQDIQWLVGEVQRLRTELDAAQEKADPWGTLFGQREERPGPVQNLFERKPGPFDGLFDTKSDQHHR